MSTVKICLQVILYLTNVSILLLQGSAMAMDRYAAAESFYKLGMAFAPVPDLHIMWLLHLCDAHQEMQSWAEAAQCAVAVAGVIMQVIIYKSGVCSVIGFEPAIFMSTRH